MDTTRRIGIYLFDQPGGSGELPGSSPSGPGSGNGCWGMNHAPFGRNHESPCEQYSVPAME